MFPCRYDVIIALTECLIAEIEKVDGVRLIANYVDSPLVWGVSVGKHPRQLLHSCFDRPIGTKFIIIQEEPRPSHRLTSWTARTSL